MGEKLMHAKTERLRHLYGWDSSYATMTPAAPESYKYPDGIVLTLKTSNHAEHYFVERAFALQLANSIKESLIAKKPKPHVKPEPKSSENKSTKRPKKLSKLKPPVN
jgi:hypothetical protein